MTVKKLPNIDFVRVAPEGANVTNDRPGDAEDETEPRLKPQALMFGFLGNFVLGRDVGIFSGSFIDVFARVGVSEHAVRSTLSRMARRGHFHRERHGRRVYYGLTRRTARILADGERRIWSTGVVNPDADLLEIARQDYRLALEQLLEIVRRDRAFGNDVGRQRMLAVFEMAAADQDMVSEYRSKLSSVLF